MKPKLLFVALLLAALSLCPAGSATPQIQVYFSPGGGCTTAITNEIAKAKTSVLVQAYSFTSAPIAKAIVDAHRRGVKVSVILDKSQRTEKYSSADFLLNSGVRPLIDSKHAIAHNKIILIDQKTVITGSFNFSNAAEERNAENVLIIQDPELAAKYVKNWQEHSAHCEAYNGRAATAQPGNATVKK